MSIRKEFVLLTGNEMRRRRPSFNAMPVLIAAFVAVSLAGFFSLYHAGFCDFRAFYCAGTIAAEGFDPYRVHPLHECERGLPAHFSPTFPHTVTLPAPYPGYAIALFALVARLPFDLALTLWTICGLIALVASIVSISRVTSTPLYATTILLGFPACVVPFPLGQPTMFILCAIASCALLLEGNRPRLAAVAALPAAIDPHVGIAVFLSLLVCVPRSRPILASAGLGLLALSFVRFGAGREWEYIHDVLPAHALANVADFGQFSLTNIAFSLGIGPRVALKLGMLWYVCSLFIGVVASVRLRRQLGWAAVPFVPVAFAAFGGVHTHLQQLDLAIPAFLLATTVAKGRWRQIALAATFGASIPWLLIAPFPYTYIAVAVLAVSYGRSMNGQRFAVVLGTGSFMVLVSLLLAVPHAVVSPGDGAPPSIAGNPLAEVPWGSFVRATFVPMEPWFLAAKAPTILAFLVMLGALCIAAVRTGARAPEPLPES